MPDPAPEPITSITDAFSQLRKLLKEAEDQADRCANLRLSSSRLRFELVAVSVGFAAAIGFVWIPSLNFSDAIKFVFTAAPIVMSLYFLGQWLPELRQQKSDLARHQRVLSGFVDLIRGMLPHHAQAERLTIIELAIVRLLLSRFDIGPGLDVPPDPPGSRAKSQIVPPSPPSKRPEELTSTP